MATRRNLLKMPPTLCGVQAAAFVNVQYRCLETRIDSAMLAKDEPIDSAFAESGTCGESNLTPQFH